MKKSFGLIKEFK